MRITIRWATKGNAKSGRMPGKFSTVQAAEDAARAFMGRYPTVTWTGIYHDASGLVREINR